MRVFSNGVTDHSPAMPQSRIATIMLASAMINPACMVFAQCSMGVRKGFIR